MDGAIAVTALGNAKPKIPAASCLQHKVANVFMEREAYTFSEVAAVVLPRMVLTTSSCICLPVSVLTPGSCRRMFLPGSEVS